MATLHIYCKTVDDIFRRIVSRSFHFKFAFLGKFLPYDRIVTERQMMMMTFGQLCNLFVCILFFGTYYLWDHISPRENIGNLKVPLRYRDEAYSQPFAILYKLILLHSANYYTFNGKSRLRKLIKTYGTMALQIALLASCLSQQSSGKMLWTLPRCHGFDDQH